VQQCLGKFSAISSRLACSPADIEMQLSVMLRGGIGEEFYGSFAPRARDLAEKADPFTKQRLPRHFRAPAAFGRESLPSSLPSEAKR
jgi:hypothetical protein